jgi:hypothetical protein
MEAARFSDPLVAVYKIRGVIHEDSLGRHRRENFSYQKFHALTKKKGDKALVSYMLRFAFKNVKRKDNKLRTE